MYTPPIAGIVPVSAPPPLVLFRRAGVIALLLALLPLGTLPRGASAHEAATHARQVSTRDGLSLDVGRSGDVAGMRVGDRVLPSNGGAGGFSLRMVGGEPNLLPNPSFEQDDDNNGVPGGWEYTSGATLPRLSSTVVHSGTRAIKVSNPTRSTSGAFSATVPVAQQTHYTFSAWIRTQNVLPTAAPSKPSPAMVKLEQLSASGSVIQTEYLNGYSDTSNWSRQFKGFFTRYGARSVRVKGLIQSGSGTAWFDDLYLGRLLQETDTAVGGAVTSQADGRLTQRATLPDQGLAFNATYTPAANHIRVDGAVAGTSAADVPFQLTYTLPVNAVGWRWGDHGRSSRPIERGTYTYQSAHISQTTSRYPFGGVFDSRSTLALGMPLDAPRVSRIAYNSRGLSITFDLGVSRAASKLGPRAAFSFVIYTADADWRFRSVTEKYYRIFPGSFIRRTDPRREGIWFITAPLDQLKTSYTQFGLGLNQVPLGSDTRGGYGTWGAQYVLWDNQRGIYGTAYNHHWAKYQRVADPARTQSYAETLARLRADAALSPQTAQETRRKEEAQAALRSTMQDPNGRLIYELHPRHVTFYQSTDPLPKAPTDWERLMQRLQVQRAVDVATAAGARLDGITIDSTSGMRRWGATNNYNRSHWATASIPLTFSYDSGLVTQVGVFTMYSHLKRLSTWLHERGMIVGANYNAAETTGGGYLMADLIDYFTFEGSINGRNFPSVSASPDGYALIKRTMAYQRPVSNLDQYIGNEAIPVGDAEQRMQQNLFYGIFAGSRSFATVAPTQRDTADPSFIPTSRWELYAKYTPIFKALAAGGWEPVTNAWPDNSLIWLERFGYVSKNNLHLTVRNDSTTTQSATITVALDKDGLRSVTGLRARELVRGQPVTVRLDAAKTRATLTITLPRKSTRVLKLTRP